MGLQNKAGQPGREPGACRTQHGQWGQQRAQEERKRGAGRDREELTKMKLVLLSRIITGRTLGAAAAAAAKSLQSCPTLCDPIDGSPPGSPVPGLEPHLGSNSSSNRELLEINLQCCSSLTLSLAQGPTHGSSYIWGKNQCN